MNSKKIAEIIKERLQRINHDYLNYASYSLAELETRESELNSIAYLMAEEFSRSEKNFNRENFMKSCGII